MLGIQHGASAAGGVGRGDGRDDDDWNISAVCGDLCSINGLSAARCHKDIHILLPDERIYSGHLFFATLSRKPFDEQRIAV
jgi:hypothetical protein